MKYRLCASCSERNQAAIAAFGKSDPSVDDWAKFFAKNELWQIMRQLTHCGPED